MKTEQNLQAVPFINAVPYNEDDEGGLNVGQLLAALRRRALLILGITSAVTLAAGLKAFSDTPVYTARFEILVQPASTEAEIISSVPSTLTGQEQQRSSQMLVTTDLLRILTSSKVLLPAVEALEAKFPGQCRRIIEPTLPSALPANLPQEELLDYCYTVLSRKVKVQPLEKESNIVQVTYQGVDPDEVQSVLEATSKAYLDYSLESRQVDIRQGIEFVEGKLPDLRDRVNLLQDQLQQLRQQYNLITPDARSSELSSQVSAFRQQSLQSQVELEQAQARASELNGQLSGATELAASSALSSNSRYQALVNQLLTLDAQIAQTSTIYLDSAPEMEVLQEQRQNLLTLLAREGGVVQEEVNGQLRELQVRDQALQETLGTLKTDVNELAVISRIYSDIERELSIATENLNQFLSRREALQIDIAQRQIPWELLTPTTDPAPTSASLPTNLILGGVLGLLLGVGAALIVERMTDVIYVVEELKRSARLPLLGTIPYTESFQGVSGTQNISASLQRLGFSFQQEGEEEELYESNTNNRKEPSAKEKHKSRYYIDPFAEAFRSLYANIRLLNSDSPIRSIVITSTQPKEGKSTTAIYLAKAAASMTRRVLLVDTDLRNPKLHDYLGLPNTGGLIDVMAGDLSLKDGVQRSPLEPNMFVLTAGAIPPDSTRLLSSQKMHRLMEQFHSNFDLVIYDTPPLIGFADTYLTAAHTNGVILVGEIGKLKRSLLEQALEQMRVARLPILGIVAQKAPNS